MGQCFSVHQMHDGREIHTISGTRRAPVCPDFTLHSPVQPKQTYTTRRFKPMYDFTKRFLVEPMGGTQFALKPTRRFKPIGGTRFALSKILVHAQVQVVHEVLGILHLKLRVLLLFRVHLRRFPFCDLDLLNELAYPSERVLREEDLVVP